MKIKYTQSSARKADADTDLALAMALGQDEAGSCYSDEDDDDFQCTGGSSSVFMKQKLALRSCAVRKHVKKRVLPSNLRLAKSRRGGGGEGGDAGAKRRGVVVSGKEVKAHCDAVLREVVLENVTACTGLDSEEREQRVRKPTIITDKRVLKDQNGRSAERVVSGKERKVHCDAVLGDVVLENVVACTGLDSEERKQVQRFRKPKNITEERVLKDQNGRPAERVVAGSVVPAKGDENGKNMSSGKLQKFSKLISSPNSERSYEKESAYQQLGSSVARDHSKQQEQSENILGIESKRKKISSIYVTGWSQHCGGTKRIKTIVQVPDNAGSQRLEQTEGRAGLDSLSIEGDESDPGAEVDEVMVICTQSKAPREVEFGPSAGELGRISLDMGKKATYDTEWSRHYGGAKSVKTIAQTPEDAGIQRIEQTEGREGLDSLSIVDEEGTESDARAEVDEDVVTSTQSKAPCEPEFGQSAGELGSVSSDMGKKAVEERPHRRHNIYDILIGNNKKDRIPTKVSNPTIDEKFECDDGEELESPGTAMQALVDQAELDYEELEFNEEDNESMDSFECPFCGIYLVDLSVSYREQHVSDCLEKDNVACERTNPMNYVGREAVNTGASGIIQLSNERTVTTDILECPVCGMCIEELSSADREAHTNACLEEGNIPYGRTNPGDIVGSEAGNTEIGGGSQTVTSQSIGTLTCPVCGVCIDELSTVQREEHTNACLDETKGVAELAEALGKPEVGPVVTWLINLNLGKYVDIFVKEEIDWDTLQWLKEEDLQSLGITALGPRRKIVCAIQQLRKPASSIQKITAMPESQRISDSVVLSSAVDTSQGPKLSIADFFIRPQSTRQPVPSPDVSILARSKAPGTVSTPGGSTGNRGQGRLISAGGNSSSAGTSDVPTWMCIPGTSFRVDAFKHKTGNCSNWFLTHFHTDRKHFCKLCFRTTITYFYYEGLTRGFRHGKIFCSIITARLVHLRIGIPLDRIEALPLNETVLIDGVRVTFIDANHCPGSVMILFEPPNGKAVLHTGDFRFCSDMASNEVLRACRITTLILDTTYCDPQYDFPKQDAVIEFVIDAIQAEAFNSKTLFLIGTYTIGKERIFLEVAKALQKYVYVGAAKRRLLDCMDLAEEDKRWLTTKDQESHIHVVPLWSVASFKRMGSISRHYHGRYNSIVAFSPTGWSFGKDKKRVHGRPGRRYQQGSIIRYEVPYSEHCSFTELKEFVRIIGSDKIVPSVISRGGLSADAMVASLLSEE